MTSKTDESKTDECQTKARKNGVKFKSTNNLSVDNEIVPNEISLNPSTSANSLTVISTDKEVKKEKSGIGWLKHFRNHKHKSNENIQKEKKKFRLHWNSKRKIAVAN